MGETVRSPFRVARGVWVTERRSSPRRFVVPAVDKGKAILLRLCERIEAERPSDLTALYVLTQAATDEFDLLQTEFEAAGSEFETVAREEIAEDSWFIAMVYGFMDADTEKLIATREWWSTSLRRT
ncbi:hypothetical protein GCM10010448_27460 [Streptomyces glomeratus]|uniref:Uncharacterized protein n=2 Tax=Streptomyces glomeratus TaxID=284452 RepID=A0ABP6LJZ4_9ACTN